MGQADTNYWFDDRCARAFWDQKRALPYHELLNDTAAWLEPKAGERWLDLGCGCGQLTAQLWKLSEGRISSIVASDCAAANAEAIDKLRQRLVPAPEPGQIIFRVADFSTGMDGIPTDSFDGIVSGLAISYAESRDPITGEYTETAFQKLLCDLQRILKPGGRLVFSINVPEPNFWKIFWRSLKPGVRIAHAGRLLLNVFRMQKYGNWLKQEARRGRFHFLPLEQLLNRLANAGFQQADSRLSYANQAYIIRVRKSQIQEAAA